MEKKATQGVRAVSLQYKNLVPRQLTRSFYKDLFVCARRLLFNHIAFEHFMQPVDEIDCLILGVGKTPVTMAIPNQRIDIMNRNKKRKIAAQSISLLMPLRPLISLQRP